MSWSEHDNQEATITITPAGDLLVMGRAMDLTTAERGAVAILCRRMSPAANPEHRPGHSTHDDTI